MKEINFRYIELATVGDRECILVRTSVWDGKKRVVIITPTKPSNEEIEHTMRLLLAELDDVDAGKRYLRRIGRSDLDKINEFSDPGLS